MILFWVLKSYHIFFRLLVDFTALKIYLFLKASRRKVVFYSSSFILSDKKNKIKLRCLQFFSWLKKRLILMNWFLYKSLEYNVNQLFGCFVLITLIICSFSCNCFDLIYLNSLISRSVFFLKKRFELVCSRNMIYQPNLRLDHALLQPCYFVLRLVLRLSLKDH